MKVKEMPASAVFVHDWTQFCLSQYFCYATFGFQVRVFHLHIKSELVFFSGGTKRESGDIILSEMPQRTELGSRESRLFLAPA